MMIPTKEYRQLFELRTRLTVIAEIMQFAQPSVDSADYDATIKERVREMRESVTSALILADLELGRMEAGQ